MTLALQTLREVRLYGPLRRQFGRSHWLAVDTPAEAVRALSVLFAGFAQALLAHTGPGYRVLVGEGPQAVQLDSETLGLRAAPGRVFRFAPVLHGAKRGGVLQVVAGVALLVAAPYMAGALFASGTAFGTSAALFIASSGGAIATSLIAGGVVQLLSPMPKGSAARAKEEASQQLSGTVNVEAAGGPVPLLIGRMMVGSVTISAGLSTDEVALANVDPGAPARPIDEPAVWETPSGGAGGGDA